MMSRSRSQGTEVTTVTGAFSSLFSVFMGLIYQTSRRDHPVSLSECVCPLKC